MTKDSTLSRVAMALVVVGALNWGLVGFFDYNLVNELVAVLFDGQTAVNVARAVYAVVGLAGVYQIIEAVDASKK